MAVNHRKRAEGMAPGALSRLDVQRVAARARVDPRTVDRALQGRTKSLVVRAAIGAALRFFGFAREAKRLEGLS